jgi:phosphopantetheine adenylyltransferase/dephospho-CoA kinase
LNKQRQVFDSQPVSENDLIAQHKVYTNSIAGGTFDRIHIGHKIMLSECALLTKNQLLIGVTTQQFLKNKKLTELIEDFDVRCANIKHFLRTISPDLEVRTVPLDDPFGPSITESDYQCLIVSQETYKNGLIINEKRKENKLTELEIHVIGIVKEDEQVISENSGDEDKVSSSNERRRLLGKLLKEPYKPYELGKPYVIGLTGGLASGKSSIRNDLQQLGAATIDCDKLGHKTYEKGTEAYRKIVETFGDEILDQSQNIDRKRLGQKVFGSKTELKKLTDIVWPEIRRMLHDEIQKQFEQGHRIIVAEAAVLLEAKWYDELNEIWVSFVPDEEAIRRATVRDQASLEKVKGILESQMPNRERIKYANVVFCSLWEREYTIKQVKKAWDSLLIRAYSYS